MRRFIAVLMLLLALSGTALAQLEFTWQEGEAFFPEGDQWNYRYSYRYPVAQGEGFAAQAINEYFDVALSEQINLVIPMYANDPIMTEGGRQEIRDEYQVTYSDDRIFSILLRHSQSIEGEALLSLRSAVFAVSGEYIGDTLTLRGVCGVGESSTQLGQAVLKDVHSKILAAIQAGDVAWQAEISLDRLSEIFYPQEQFYALGGDRLVFYMQPGELRDDDQVIEYTYTYSELEELLESGDKP